MLTPFLLRFRQDGMIVLAVRARPNAPKTQCKAVLKDGSLKIDLHAPAEEGKANMELRKFLAAEFEVPLSQVTLMSGKRSRVKLVKISDAR